MKRDFDDDGPSPNKRQRNSGDEEVTFLIPSRMAGSIIGKGGTNITRLRNKYKASITVPDCPGPERVLTISSASTSTVLEIVKKILPNLVDNSGGRNEVDDLDIRLLIHQSRAGCVIGKAGAKIKELREKTGARMKIFSNTAPQSTERVLQIIGNENEVAGGIREVLDLIQKTPIKPPMLPYDPHNYDDFYADQYGGFGVGQGGPPPSGPRGPRGPPQRGGPPPRMPPMAPGRGPIIRGGPPMGRNGPMGPGPRPFNDFGGPRNNFNGPPRGGNFGGNFGGGNRNESGNMGFNGNNGGNQGDQSTQVTIPKDLAGAIIGKSGSRIRKIRAESGAGIEIAEPLPGADDRVITITGSPHAIQMAQYLLQQSVHESNPGLARGNKF